MTIIEALVDLQEVDGRIRDLELELKDLPRRKALETARLSGVSADLQSAKAGEEKANQRVREYEEEAKSLEEKIQQLKMAQAGLKTNKEYQDFSIRIDLLTHELDAAENNQLAASDDVPGAKARVEEAQAKYDAEKGGVDEFCAEIDARIADVEARLAEARKERPCGKIWQLRNGCPPEAYSRPDE